jgi:RimJ/RimL family protein N-acetyltransferase
MIPRKLSHLDRQKLIDHFMNDIVDEDRRLRFGFEAPDTSVKEYINKSIDYDYGYCSMWFVVDEGDRIVATCHVSLNKETNTAEMGCTVSPDFRNQKVGQELFNRGITWARMAGAEHVFMHCLSENKIIQHIAKKGGMTVVTIDPSEKESTIQVKQNRFEAGFKDYIMDTIAVYDMAVRQQYFFTKKFLKGFVK